MAVQPNTTVSRPRHKSFLHGWRAHIVPQAMVLVFVASLAALIAPSVGQVASAGDGGNDRHEVLFTKWITAFPNMQGVVSGISGPGLFAGEINDIETTGSITTIHAAYHINGGNHPFTASVTVKQDNTTGTATIEGVVTEGWRVNAKVEGAYQVISPCSTVINAGFNQCFQGTLHLLGGSGR